jgi:UDP-N-acetylglucosamine acyltransferase
VIEREPTYGRSARRVAFGGRLEAVRAFDAVASPYLPSTEATLTSPVFLSPASLNLSQSIDRLSDRYPSLLVDAVEVHEPGARLVAVKNVTVNEDFFQGHFPGTPLMPGVLMIEALAQAATMLALDEDGSRVFLRGVNNAKFRKQVVPGDRVTLEISIKRRRRLLVAAHGVARVGAQIVAEAELLLGVIASSMRIHPTAVVHPGAVIGEGTEVGPHAVIGPHVRIGAHCTIGASSVVDGWTRIGERNAIFPFASIGLAPQDQKYRGEETRLDVGDDNVFREFVTIHRGTRGGGGMTAIGSRNLFMAYAHVAHDCRVGSDTIFGPGATLGGHVAVEDFATISAYSGVHQFCRVGRHAFIGGYSVVTLDALPFAKTVGNRARIYGLNTVGLARRGFPPDIIKRLRQAYRYLLVSKLGRRQALAEIEGDPLLACDEVRYLTQFIRDTSRGVTLRRASRRVAEPVAEE